MIYFDIEVLLTNFIVDYSFITNYKRFYKIFFKEYTMSFKEPDILPSNSFNETNQEGLLTLIYLDLRNIFQIIGDLIKKFWLLVVLIILIFIIIKATVFVTESGYIDLYENPITHDIETYDRPLLRLLIRWQISYMKEIKISFSYRRSHSIKRF